MSKNCYHCAQEHGDEYLCPEKDAAQLRDQLRRACLLLEEAKQYLDCDWPDELELIPRIDAFLAEVEK